MADTQALAALLARVESGTGEDRELDANVALLFGVVIARYTSDHNWRTDGGFIMRPAPHWQPLPEPPEEI